MTDTLPEDQLPRDLPRTLEELNAFIEDFCKTYELPNNASYQRAIATMLQHLGESQFQISKHQLFQQVKRTEGMRAAFLKIRELNLQEEAERKALKQEAEKNGETAETPCPAVVPEA